MKLTPVDYIPACAAGVELAVFPGGEDPATPVVFVIHGRDGTMHHRFDLCRTLAAEGFTAVTLDQRNHGRRQVDKTARSDLSPTVATELFAEVVGTAQDIQLVIDLLGPQFGLAPSRIGITGNSLGGIAAIVAMGLDERIDAGAAMLGTGDFLTLMEDYLARQRVDRDDVELPLPEPVQAFYRKYDAIHRAEGFADRPLLLTAGEEDQIVSPVVVKAFAEALRPHYTHAERLIYQLYPAVEHETTEEMKAAVVAWLRRWLLG